MRTFRLLGMAMIAIMVCVNFTTCSSDDEIIKDDDGVITSEKRLMQIKYSSDNTRDFSYDTKGRLASVTHRNNTYERITNYTWGNNIIIEEIGEKTYTYSLNDGLVRTIRYKNNSDWSNKSFTYNSYNQQLTVEEISGDDIYTSTCTWENERIIKSTYSERGDNSEYTYTYSGKTCKGYFPIYNLFSFPPDDDEIFSAHPELIGLRISQLPDQIYEKRDDREIIGKYTYTFDKDGYMESCTIVETEKRLDINETHTSTTIYTFKWE